MQPQAFSPHIYCTSTGICAAWDRAINQYRIKLSTGNDRRMPIHFSRSINKALTFFFKFDSKFDFVCNNCWCCDSASCSLRCRTAIESWMSHTSCTNRTCGKSLCQKGAIPIIYNGAQHNHQLYLLSFVSYLHCSSPDRWPRASKRVWATFNGFALSWIALRNKSMFRSMSKISCCVLCKCNCILFFASHISAERLFSELFVLLQLSHVKVATRLISVSVSLRNWADLPRSLCDLRNTNFLYI